MNYVSNTTVYWNTLATLVYSIVDCGVTITLLCVAITVYLCSCYLCVCNTGVNKPLPPSSLTVSYLDADSVMLEWTRPFGDGDCPLLHYVLEKRDQGRSAAIGNSLITRQS